MYESLEMPEVDIDAINEKYSILNTRPTIKAEASDVVARAHVIRNPWLAAHLMDLMNCWFAAH